MRLRIRTAVLTAAMTVVMGAAASAAQATPVFEAGSYPVTAKGESSLVVIGTEGGNIECATNNFSGTLGAASSSLLLQPVVFKCIGWGFVAVTINTQGCGYRLDAAEKSATDEYKAKFAVSCPGSGGFLWAAETCAIEIPPQEGLTGVALKDNTTAPQRVSTTFEVKNLTYVVTKDGFLCPLKGTGTKTNGTITGNAFELKAFNASEKEVGLTVSGS